MCGWAFWQLKQLYVQNSTSTTFSPAASFIERPSVLMRPVEPVISLARVYLASLLAIRSASEISGLCFALASRFTGLDLSVSLEGPVANFFISPEASFLL